jgi:hypothetical protein
MQCAEPKVAYVQPNTREAKNIVKLERTLTYMEKLTTTAAGDYGLALAHYRVPINVGCLGNTGHRRREANRRE